MNRKKTFFLLNVLLGTVLFLTSYELTAAVSAATVFEETTDNAGISYVGPSFGISWGDFNGDGFPDVWANNHGKNPYLYLNNGDGTFSDIRKSVMSYTNSDTHGGAWADFDNDGDQDFIEVIGAGAGMGEGPNLMFVNNSGILEDKAAELGLEYPLGRGRTPVWLDFNGDGLLDVFISNVIRVEAPTVLFQQTSTGFINVNDIAGVDLTNTGSLFAQISDLFGDGSLDIIVQGSPYPYKVYDTASIPFEDITESVNLPANTCCVDDAAIADFNNDLLPDIYMARISMFSTFVQENERILFRASVSNQEKGIRFTATGESIQFKIEPTWKHPITDIRIGSDGHQPSDYSIIDQYYSFSLSADDVSNTGIEKHEAGTDRGIYIGYDPAAQRWQLLISRSTSVYMNSEIQADFVDNATAIGFDPAGVWHHQTDKLFINSGTGFENRTVEAGLGNPVSGTAVAAGDFDNDMDVDIYLCTTAPLANSPNILYENQGDGTFVPVQDAGGATGSAAGRSESVATADYDNDGFLDLFVANGRGSFPPICSGPYQLFHNIGNANHWLEIDLEGRGSNRDGIGSRVLVTAGGVTQLREQNGGIHRNSQNHRRIHFGLGSNTRADSVVIYWPSGNVQELQEVAADQILRIIEDDGDGVSEEVDNCPYTYNPDQHDADGDGVGDACDKCPSKPNGPDNGTCTVGENTGSSCTDNAFCGIGGFCSMSNDDADGDGIGDACDSCPADQDNDLDEDGQCGDEDNCLDVPNPDQSDNDTDGIGDACDNCPLHCNSDQLDADNDNIGDVCDPAPGCGGCGEMCEQECLTTLDTDKDGVVDAEDNCIYNCNFEQLDADGDGIGDVCDSDPGCGGCVESSCEQQCIIE